MGAGWEALLPLYNPVKTKKACIPLLAKIDRSEIVRAVCLVVMGWCKPYCLRRSARASSAILRASVPSGRVRPITISPAA